jgi:hypothetical protein
VKARRQSIANWEKIWASAFVAWVNPMNRCQDYLQSGGRCNLSNQEHLVGVCGGLEIESVLAPAEVVGGFSTVSQKQSKVTMVGASRGGVRNHSSCVDVMGKRARNSPSSAVLLFMSGETKRCLKL